jgi:hypothetical protein
MKGCAEQQKVYVTGGVVALSGKGAISSKLSRPDVLEYIEGDEVVTKR